MAGGEGSAEDVAQRVAERFPVGRWLRGYIRGKIRWDPAYEEVAERVASGTEDILDIGCGLGLLGFYLRERGLGVGYRGVDTDAGKIALAARVAAGDGAMDFRVMDAAVLPDAAPVTVVLDVLHYLDDTAQKAFLDNLARTLPKGGMVIIRNAPDDGSWRYRLTVLEEWWVRLSRWIGVGGAINFPTIHEVVSPFERAGHRVEVGPLWGKTPFNSYLFVVHG